MKTVQLPQTPRVSQLFEIQRPSKGSENGLKTLLAHLPTLPPNPKEALKTITRHLRNEGFAYDHGVFRLDDVTSKKRGNCLGLSHLVTELLTARGKSPKCRILIRPMDATDRADRKLFQQLTQGEYFDYNRPVLPTPSDRPDANNRPHRFVSLAHPLVVLENVPFETTLATEDDSHPFHQFPAESTIEVDSNALKSFSLSDQAKIAFAKKSKDEDLPTQTRQKILYSVEDSLKIFPDNRDALELLWRCGRALGDHNICERAKKRLLDFGPVDSDLSYKLWCITRDPRYLDITLEQFPENIPAFLERKVFLEKDWKEARMNLAVALWCINYSSRLSLKAMLMDPGLRRKVSELFPHSH